MYLTFLRIIQRTPTCWWGELRFQQVVSYFSEVKPERDGSVPTDTGCPLHSSGGIYRTLLSIPLLFTVHISPSSEQREVEKKKVGESFMSAWKT